MRFFVNGDKRIKSMRIVMMIIYLLVIIIGISFAVLNSTSVQVDFYITTIKMPVSMFMFLMLGIGIVVGFVFYLPKSLRLKYEIRNLKAQLRLTEKEIKNLRAIPLQDQH